jgi:hypothetical protein
MSDGKSILRMRLERLADRRQQMPASIRRGSSSKKSANCAIRIGCGLDQVGSRP